jgi:hypothetical protein
MTRPETRPFYRPVVLDALKTLGYDPAETIQLDYPATGAVPGPCLALALKDSPELALFAVAVVHNLHVSMVYELAYGWTDWLKEMLQAARFDGRVYYFPGWTLQ